MDIKLDTFKKAFTGNTVTQISRAFLTNFCKIQKLSKMKDQKNTIFVGPHFISIGIALSQ